LNRGVFLIIIIIAGAVLLAVGLSAVIVTCNNKKPVNELAKDPPVEEAEDEIALINDDAEKEMEIEAGQTAQDSEAHTSMQVSRISSSGLSRIRGGRVNLSEIDPINYNNPDIDVLRHMGADQSLISYFTGEQHYRNADYDRAIAEYTAAINRNHEFLAAFISRGNAWMKKNDYTRAIEDFSRAIRLDSTRAELYNYRGFARSARGEMSPAIDDFSRAITLNRNYVDALINRSHAYYQTGNFDRTIEDCDQILRLEPANAVIWNRRGSAWYRKDDDDRAIRDFSEAIRLNANYSLALYNRANAYYSKRDFDRSLADLNRCISINPSFAPAYTSRGNLLRLLGNTESANADFAAAQRLQRN